MEIVLIAFSLSADAFAVLLSCGASGKKIGLKYVFRAAAFFGFFQALMPASGYFFARLWAKQFLAFGHWISFALLAFVGAKMILEGLNPEDGDEKKAIIADLKNVLLLSVATSIDAFAVGVSFAFNAAPPILLSVATIGIITFFVSSAGFWAGQKFSGLLGKKAEILGGAVLIGIGLKIVAEHYFF